MKLALDLSYLVWLGCCCLIVWHYHWIRSSECCLLLSWCSLSCCGGLCRIGSGLGGGFGRMCCWRFRWGILGSAGAFGRWALASMHSVLDSLLELLVSGALCFELRHSLDLRSRCFVWLFAYFILPCSGCYRCNVQHIKACFFSEYTWHHRDIEAFGKALLDSSSCWRSLWSWTSSYFTRRFHLSTSRHRFHCSDCLQFKLLTNWYCHHSQLLQTGVEHSHQRLQNWNCSQN